MARPRRLYAASLPASGGVLALDDDALKHAKGLRLEAGDTLELFDARGGSAAARVVKLDRRALICELSPPMTAKPPAARVTLVVGIPKAAKLESIVRMATELGIHAIRLAQSERAVSRLDRESPKLE